ncbi:MAG: GAF domain-containing protein, partial [Desulfobacteraceae bacterium]
TWINGHPINPGFQIEIKEGDTVAVGNISMSLGEPFSEDGLVTQYSISLSDLTEESRKDLLYKDRRITDRDRLEMIYDVSTVLLQSLEIDEICEEMMDAIFSCLPGIDSGAVLMIDHETGEHRQIVARSREDSQTFQMNYSQTIVNRVIRDGRAIMLSDIGDTDKQDLSASIIMMQIKSVMCVPLISKSEIHGVIYVHSVGAAQGFQRDDLFLLTSLSIPAALAIENALLFSKHTETEEALQSSRNELEVRVEERTNELSEANERLRKEVAERQQAEENLKAMQEQLIEANKNLELAYAQMRKSKDQLTTRLYEEEIAFLTDENGLIQGFNEKALESTGLSRFKLFKRNIGDLLDEESKQKLVQDMRDAWIGIFHQTPLRLMENQTALEMFEAKLMPVNFESGKMLLVLLRRPNRET